MDDGSRANSTLELVVNERQLQNMSQIDLSRAGDNQASQSTNQHQSQSSFLNVKEWPKRLKESISSKIDEAKAKSTNKTEFILKLIQAFSGTAIWFLCFICTIIMPIILLFVGLFSLDNCQDKPSLPYLVFATGFTMTASNLFNLALAMDLPVLTNQSILSSDIKNTIASIINIIFNCVVAFVYILCAYKVYTIKSKTQNSLLSDNGASDTGSDVDSTTIDCNPILYYLTFWFVTLTLGSFSLLITLGGIFFAYNKYRLAIIRGSTPRSQQTNTINTNPASAF